MVKKMDKLVNSKGRRADGRKLNELRPIKMEVGVIDNADGSAYIEFGKNKIIVAVYGPQDVHPKHMTETDTAILKCRYHMTPFSTGDRKNPAPSRREMEISKVIREALEPAIVMTDYPRTAIHVYVEVLQSDGGSRCAGVTAASLALADAGINMRDLIAGCAAGKIDGNVALDLDEAEDMKGDADLPLAILPNLQKITLLQLDGTFSQKEFSEAFNLAKEGCMKVYEMQRNALKDKYFRNKEL
jgi:exosome complex component RRP41